MVRLREWDLCCGRPVEGRRWRLTGTGPLAVVGLWTFVDAGESEITG